MTKREEYTKGLGIPCGIASLALRFIFKYAGACAGIASINHGCIQTRNGSVTIFIFKPYFLILSVYIDSNNPG
jgi:hypothetical protein